MLAAAGGHAAAVVVFIKVQRSHTLHPKPH